MSDRELANEEMKKVLRWANEETDKLTEKLKEEGRYIGGLDGQSEEYTEIDDEAKRQLCEIKKRYKH